ncbi:biopolymer transporter ExbD [Synechococcus sp. PCC 7336]|uniref:ExbD/TolR family protein n=1 Tax=Synechococcus sp. PCC 7336 TaxID=195250 RepID=UPI00034A4B34|nr:biopolymer transporter ExbD [Synechococcus sp. PCC 7336]
MQIPQEPRRPAEINIVPLIDIIFCILVFFVVASLVLTRSEGLDVTLPKASTAQPKIQPAVNVSVTDDNEIAVNREVVSLEALVPTIEGILEAQPEEDANRLIVLNADLALTHGNVVQVMNELRKVEDVRLAIAARRDSEN